MLNNTLRFSDVYAASKQRQAIDAGQPRDYFFRNLRLDTLLSKQVAIPDTYLLDGAFFLQVKPEEVRDRLGRSGSGQLAPLSLRCRRPTINDSLRMLLVLDANNPVARLNGFPFNAISDAETRDALAALLSNCTTADYLPLVGAAKDVPLAITTFLRGLLSSRGLDADEDLDQMRAGWTYWIESERRLRASGDLAVSTWNAKLDLKEVAADPRYCIDQEKELLTDRGRNLYQQISHGINHGSTLRSEAMLKPRYLNDFSKNAGEKADAATVLAWYDGVRHRAIARQHGCTAFAHMLRSDASAVGPLERGVRDIARTGARMTDEVTVPEDFYNRLVDVESDRYSQIIRNASADLDAWWREGDTDSLRRIIDSVMNADSTRTKQKADGLIEVFGYVTMGAVSISVPAPAGLVAGHIAKTIVTRGAKGLIRAESNQRVVEYLTQRHFGYAP